MNRGQPNDHFDDVFGANAAAARNVIDAAIVAWERVIGSFNYADGSSTFNLSLGMYPDSTGHGASGGPSAVLAGKPKAGGVGIGRGDDLNGDGLGDGGRWFVDPSPFDISEFAGNIVNAFAGDAPAGSPANAKFDLFTIAVVEMTHALGLISFAGGSSYLFQTSGLNTNTGIPDTAEGGGRGTFWVFNGPSIKHLMTSNNGGGGGGDWGYAVHSAGPGVPVNFGGFTYIGAQDVGNAVYEGSRRYLVPNTFALIFKDAYNYSTVNPAAFGTMYANYNGSTLEVRVRGGAGASADDITIESSGSTIRIRVDVGDDVPGTGALPGSGDLPAFVFEFATQVVTSIVVEPGGGDDFVNVRGLDGTTRLTINAGDGNDSIVLGNGDLDSDLLHNITVNGGAGADKITFNDLLEADPSFDTYNINPVSGVPNAVRLTKPSSIRWWEYNGVESIELFASPQGSTINVNAVAPNVSTSIWGGGGNDTIYVGNGDFDSNIAGNILCHGGADIDAVVVTDTADTGADTYNFVSNRFAKAAPSATLTYNSMESFYVYGSNDPGTFNIQSNVATVPLRVLAGGGDDQINLGNGNLSNLPATVTLEGQAGTDSLMVRDDLSGTADGYTLSAIALTRTGSGGLNYSGIEAATLRASTGNNTISVTGTQPGFGLTIFGNNGTDTITLYSNSGPAVLILASAGDDHLRVNADNVGTAEIRLDATQRLGSLIVGTGGSATVAATSGDIVLTTASLQVNAGGRLDLTDEDMIIDYTAASPIVAVQQLVTSGYAGGAWNGNGIFSSAAAATPGRAIGYGESAQIFSSFPATFSGQSVDNTAILLKHTLYGDADLSGAVNLQDFNRLAANFGQSPRRWIHGNFDFDSDVDLLDSNRLASHFGSGGLAPADDDTEEVF